jgi:uncharacterized protein with PQ loop repeat
MNLVLTFLAVTASVLGSGMAFPQALRMFRTGTTEGVSSTWIGVSLAINAWWTAYALTVSLWALLPVSVVSFLLYAWIAAIYTRACGRAALPGMLVGGFVLGMAPLPALVFGGWEVAGVAIGLSYGLQLAPAVIASYRTDALDGVAPGTWIISFVEAALWVAYGFGVSDPALVAGGAAGVLMAGAIIARLAFTGFRPLAVRRRRPLQIA